jgi:hypothetical protein
LVTATLASLVVARTPTVLVFVVAGFGNVMDFVVTDILDHAVFGTAEDEFNRNRILQNKMYEETKLLDNNFQIFDVG